MAETPTSAPSNEPGPPAKSDYTWPVVVGVFLAFWVVYLWFAGPRKPAEIDLNAPGAPAEYDWTVRSLDGTAVKFAKFEGKAVFLNVWATWCPPCVAEMPSIARLAADPSLKGKNIEFVCVAIDDEIDTVRRYVSDKNWPMTIVHADRLPGVFLTDGIPATFIIAPDGRVVSQSVGGQKWDGPETVESLRAVAAVAPRTPAASAPADAPGA